MSSLPVSAELIPRLLLAFVVIALAARGGRLAARTFGQPALLGEICAGLALGPSLLGAIVPGSGEALFGGDVKPWLDFVGNAGIVVLMVGVGAQLDLSRVGGRGVAARVGLGGVAVPLLIGAPVAALFTATMRGSGAPAWACASFVTVSIAVTAFPVLARIVDEGGLGEQRLGRLAMAAAAVTDACAWAMLLIIGALAAHDGAGTTAVAGDLARAIGFCAVGWLGTRALVRRAHGRAQVLVVALSATVLALLASHFAMPPMAGGLMAGLGGRAAVLPLARTERFNRAVLLPFAFVAIGIKVDIGAAIGHPDLLLAAVVITLVALLAKLAGCYPTGRLSGLSPREAAGLGFLMNTKGLTDVVVLKTAFEAGALSSAAFAVLIVSSLVATIVALPVLRSLGVAPRPQTRRRLAIPGRRRRVGSGARPVRVPSR